MTSSSIDLNRTKEMRYAWEELLMLTESWTRDTYCLRTSGFQNICADTVQDYLSGSKAGDIFDFLLHNELVRKGYHMLKSSELWSLKKFVEWALSDWILL